MENDNRILLIQKFLYEQTDTDHDVSSKDIMRMLESHGHKTPDKRTIEADVDALIAAGYDIQKSHRNGVPTRYHVDSRDFDTVELKILIDAVAASRFISPERSKRLIDRLASMACIADREGLCSETESLMSIKHAAGRTMYVADGLYRGIVSRKKIQFQMVDYQIPDLEPAYHRDGYVYTVSPYAMVWNHDRYYLIAHEEERDQILTPRVDRIKNVKVLDSPIKPKPDGFDIGQFYNLNYKMFSGPESDVTILCDNKLIGQFIDRFGKNFECQSVSDKTFQATVRTAVSPTFFGWLFQYAGDMSLVGPPEVVEQYNKHRRKAARGPKT